MLDVLVMPKRVSEKTTKELRALPRKLEAAGIAKKLVAVGGAKYLYCRCELPKDGSVWLSFVFNYPHPVTGSRVAMGLGSLDNISLRHAREEAIRLHGLLESGIDPLTARNDEKLRKLRDAVKLVRFRDYAPDALDRKTAGLKDVKSGPQHHSTFTDYVYPVIGKLQIPDIEVEDILQVMSQETTKVEWKKNQEGIKVKQIISGSFWEVKHDNAKKVLDRIKWVLNDWRDMPPRTKGYENPADKNIIGTQLPAVRKEVIHHESLDYRDCPKMYEWLAEQDFPAAKTLMFLIIHAGRVSEITKMKWSEIDFEKGFWVCPANRMKNGKEFHEPLTQQSIELLTSLPRLGDFVWKEGGISGTALKACHERSGFLGTRHGFRASFGVFSEEVPKFDNNLIGLCMSHTKPQLEQAYQRSDLRERRREVMQTWATYLAGVSVV
jgi:integrase